MFRPPGNVHELQFCTSTLPLRHHSSLQITFYCLKDHREGLFQLSRAASAGHPDALHSLSVIHFNGSAGNRSDRNPSLAVLLAAQAAAAGNLTALKELGHCLMDGYGVERNAAEGRRILVKANRAEEEKRRVVPDSSMSKRQRMSNSPDEAAEGTWDTQMEDGRAPGSLSGSQLATGHACQHCVPVACSQAADNGSTEGQPRVSSGLVLPASAWEATEVQQGRESDRPDGWRAAPPPTALKRTMSTPSHVGHHAGASYPASAHADPHEQNILRSNFSAIATVARYLRYGPRRAYDGVSRPASNLPSRMRAQHNTGGVEKGCYTVNRFMLDWHKMHGLPAGQNVCGNQMCGRVESRCQEFRCCSACTLVPYCSRACQAADWKVGHKRVCMHLAGLSQENLTMPPRQVMQLFLVQALVFPV